MTPTPAASALAGDGAPAPALVVVEELHKSFPASRDLFGRPTGAVRAFDGVDVATLGSDALRRLRRRMQLVFQDPYSSLNPRLSVGAIVREGLIVHGLAEGAAADARVAQLLEEVGL